MVTATGPLGPSTTGRDQVHVPVSLPVCETTPTDPVTVTDWPLRAARNWPLRVAIDPSLTSMLVAAFSVSVGGESPESVLSTMSLPSPP